MASWKEDNLLRMTETKYNYIDSATREFKNSYVKPVHLDEEPEWSAEDFMGCSEFLVIEPERETLGTPEDREIYDTKTGYVFSEKDVYDGMLDTFYYTVVANGSKKYDDISMFHYWAHRHPTEIRKQCYKILDFYKLPHFVRKSKRA